MFSGPFVFRIPDLPFGHPQRCWGVADNICDHIGVPSPQHGIQEQPSFYSVLDECGDWIVGEPETGMEGDDCSIGDVTH